MRSYYLLLTVDNSTVLTIFPQTTILIARPFKKTWRLDSFCSVWQQASKSPISALFVSFWREFPDFSSFSNGCLQSLRLQLHGAIYRPDFVVLTPRHCVKLKAIRYESTSLNRIAADKSHRVTKIRNSLDSVAPSLAIFKLCHAVSRNINHRVPRFRNSPVQFWKDSSLTSQNYTGNCQKRFSGAGFLHHFPLGDG